MMSELDGSEVRSLFDSEVSVVELVVGIEGAELTVVVVESSSR